jgi:hypothetical protein
LERRVLPYLAMFLLVTVSACSQEAEQRAEAAEAKVAQLNQIAAAKDSLTREMMATTTFMTELNDELAKVKPAKGSKTNVVQGETVVALEDYRAGMITKIKDLRSRLDENEKRLASTSERLRKLSAGNKELSAQIAAYDSMVVGYKRIMDDQRTQIAVLTNNVDALQKKNQVLADENTHLTSRVSEMTDFANAVYYVLGNKKELMEKGVVAQVGGSRVLGVGWRTGETLVPGTNLNETAFQRSSKSEATEIALPDPTKKYRLVSPQNVNSLATKPGKDGKFTGTSIKIADPESFWAPSKFLILVEG